MENFLSHDRRASYNHNICLQNYPNITDIYKTNSDFMHLISFVRDIMSDIMFFKLTYFRNNVQQNKCSSLWYFFITFSLFMFVMFFQTKERVNEVRLRLKPLEVQMVVWLCKLYYHCAFINTHYSTPPWLHTICTLTNRLIMCHVTTGY